MKPHILKFRSRWFCDGAHGKTPREAWLNWYRSLRITRAVSGVLAVQHEAQTPSR
jgi:hypothetical protein